MKDLNSYHLYDQLLDAANIIFSSCYIGEPNKYYTLLDLYKMTKKGEFCTIFDFNKLIPCASWVNLDTIDNIYFAGSRYNVVNGQIKYTDTGTKVNYAIVFNNYKVNNPSTIIAYNQEQLHIGGNNYSYSLPFDRIFYYLYTFAKLAGVKSCKYPRFIQEQKNTIKYDGVVTVVVPGEIKQLKKYVSDEDRPGLNDICFDFSTGSFVASDGRILKAIKAGYCSVSGTIDIKKIIIPVEAVNDIAGKEITIYCYNNGEGLTKHTNGTIYIGNQFVANCIDGKYPNWNSVIQHVWTDNNVISISIKEWTKIQEAAKQVKKISVADHLGQKFVIIRGQKGTNNIELCAVDNYEHEIISIHSVELSQTLQYDIAILLRVDHILLLKKIYRIFFNDSSRAVVFASSDSVNVVMPVGGLEEYPSMCFCSSQASGTEIDITPIYYNKVELCTKNVPDEDVTPVTPVKPVKLIKDSDLLPTWCTVGAAVDYDNNLYYVHAITDNTIDLLPADPNSGSLLTIVIATGAKDIKLHEFKPVQANKLPAIYTYNDYNSILDYIYFFITIADYYNNILYAKDILNKLSDLINDGVISVSDLESVISVDPVPAEIDVPVCDPVPANIVDTTIDVPVCDPVSAVPAEMIQENEKAEVTEANNISILSLLTIFIHWLLSVCTRYVDNISDNNICARARFRILYLPGLRFAVLSMVHVVSFCSWYHVILGAATYVHTILSRGPPNFLLVLTSFLIKFVYLHYCNN